MRSKMHRHSPYTQEGTKPPICMISSRVIREILPMFGFRSAKYDIDWTKSFLLLLLVNEREIDLIVIKKTNQFVSFRFGHFQQLILLIKLEGGTRPDSFQEALRTSEPKGFFCISRSIMQKICTLYMLNLKS